MNRRIRGIAAFSLAGFITIQLDDMINHFRGIQPYDFGVTTILGAVGGGLVGGIITYALDNAPDERGKPKEWDRDDWIDPLANEEDEMKK